MDRVAKQMITSILSSKLKESLACTAKYNVYSTAVIKDFNSAQAMTAAFFHFLVVGDDTAAVTFFEILGQIPQMASSYIGVWLKDDFRFIRKDVAQALDTLARIVVSQRISVNSPLVSSVTCLEEKYSLCGYFSQYLVVWAEHSGKLAAKERPPRKSSSAASSISAKARAKVSSLPVASRTASATASTLQTPAKLAANTLESAVCRNDVTAIALLARGNVNKVTDAGHSLLFTAVSAGFVEATAALCAAGTVWRSGEVRTLFKKALDTDSPVMIKALAKSGVDLASCKDSNGNIYLHLAAKRGKVAIVASMLAVGVDINSKAYGSWTPLHCASYNGQLSTVQLLLLRGAAVNAGNDFEQTPLHLAAANGNTGVIAALCTAGADVNCKDVYNITPLGLALLFNKMDAAKLLASKGGVM